MKPTRINTLFASLFVLLLFSCTPNDPTATTAVKQPVPGENLMSSPESNEPARPAAEASRGIAPAEIPVEVAVRAPTPPVAPPQVLRTFVPAPEPSGASSPAPAPVPAPVPAPTSPEPAPPVMREAVLALKPATPPVSPLKIDILPQYGLVRTGTAAEMNVLVRLTGTSKFETKKQPLDMAIVIDQSGSMRGTKIRQVRQAAMDLVDKLDDKDRVTLIAYDQRVKTMAILRDTDQQGKATLKDRMLEIRAGGRTALGPALFKALGILEGAERGEADIAHVLLLSDGIANVGETRPKAIGSAAATGFARGVSVSTLGVGLDYNEDLMTRVADQGGGRYHFIKDAAAITAVLNDELAGLASTVARGIVLDLRPAAGARVTKVFGYATSEKNGVTSIKVGALYAGQTREILVRVALPAASGSQAPIGTFVYRLRDVTADGTEVVDEVASLVGVTSTPEEVQKSEKTEVTIRVAEVESAQDMDKVARAVDRGDYARAKGMINSRLGRLREQNKATPSVKLEAQISGMEEAFGEVDEAKSSSSARREFIKGKKASSYDLMK
jgi:Ca-activated chloride channel homolog